MTLQDFINFPRKEELLLGLSSEFVLYDGVVYPSLDYLQNYFKLQDSDIFKLCCSREILGEGLYNRSAPYGSEELLSIRKVKSNLVLDFSDGTSPYISDKDCNRGKNPRQVPDRRDIPYKALYQSDNAVPRRHRASSRRAG